MSDAPQTGGNVKSRRPHRNRIDNDYVNRTASAKLFGDFKSLFACIRL